MMAGISNELRLAIACSRWPATPQRDKEVAGLVRAGIDWPAFMHLVQRHQIFGQVQAALVTAGVAPPPPHGKMLALASLKLARNNRRLAGETARLQRRFDEAQIPAVFFKGSTLSQLIYGTVDLKHSGDIDFLVAPDDVPHVLELLRQDGYQDWYPGALTKAQWRNAMHFYREVSMVDVARAFHVEPHWRLSWSQRLLAWIDPAAPAVEVALGGHGKARTLQPDDLYIYLAAHGAGHSWSRLKWLADFQALVATFSQDQLAARHREAAARGAEPESLWALAAAEAVLGLELPEVVARQIRSDRAIRYLTRASLRSLQSLSEWPRWRDTTANQIVLARKQGVLLSRFWRTVAVDVLEVPLPRPLWFLFPVLRLPLGLRRLARRKTQRKPDRPGPPEAEFAPAAPRR